MSRRFSRLQFDRIAGDSGCFCKEPYQFLIRLPILGYCPQFDLTLTRFKADDFVSTGIGNGPDRQYPHFVVLALRHKRSLRSSVKIATENPNSQQHSLIEKPITDKKPTCFSTDAP